MESLEEAAEAIARAIGLDAAEADQRKAFLEFTDRDAALLRELHGRLGNAQDDFVNAFYTHLLAFDESRAFLSDPAVLERVKRSQAAYFGRLDPDADEFIGCAVEGATRMQELINDLLEYSRVDTRGEIFEIVSGSAAFQQAVTNLQTLIQETGAVITQDSLPVVKGNPLQCAMVFQNLIGNAIKFRGGNPRASTSRPGGTGTPRSPGPT